MKRSITPYTLLFSFLALFTNAQEDKALLRSIFKSMANEQAAQEKEQVFYMNYSLHTVHADSLLAPTEVTIELWKKNKLIEIKSAQMNVFQDETSAFIVLPDKQLIMRNDAAEKKITETEISKSMALYDTLLTYSVVTESVPEKTKKYDRKISITVNGRGQQLFKVKNADYYIDTKKKVISKVRIHYSDQLAAASKIRYVDYIINDLQQDFKGKALSANVSSHFFKNGKLKDNYKTYKLVDNRASVKKRETYND